MRRIQASMMRVAGAGVLAFGLAAGCGSGVGSTPTSPPCDQMCQDGVGILALRLTMKWVFNNSLQGKPVGPQDAMVSCPMGGTAHVTGTATSNAVQGATMVQLAYVLTSCAYMLQETDPNRTFSVTLTGTVTESGTLAVQPTATTSIGLQSDSMTITGSVYDPGINYAEMACPVVLAQDGNMLSGMICGRSAGATL